MKELTIKIKKSTAQWTVGEVFDRLLHFICSVNDTDNVVVDNQDVDNHLLNSCIEFYCDFCKYDIKYRHIVSQIFDLKKEQFDAVWGAFDKFLENNGITKLRQPIVYFVEEMFCNIQQHSQADKCLFDYWVENECVNICIADNGLSILGSFVEHQKYIDIIGDNDAQAVALAHKGYSTKNLPDTENRGYGISSNVKMIVKGLKGCFCILSGSALMLAHDGGFKILSIPSSSEWPGTLVYANIPLKLSESFNFYDYIN